jgi:hypothetical protein
MMVARAPRGDEVEGCHLATVERVIWAFRDPRVEETVKIVCYRWRMRQMLTVLAEPLRRPSYFVAFARRNNERVKQAIGSTPRDQRLVSAGTKWHSAGCSEAMNETKRTT